MLAEPDLQAEIINNLQKLPGDTSIDWRIIIWNLIDVNSIIDLAIFDKKNWSVPGPKYILDWMNANEDASIGRNWINLLRNDPKIIL